jgi:uncharacterized repeat protein (TIGR01451 family)
LFESVITATKTDNLAPGTAVDPGDTLQYSVVVANNGDEDATDVVFEDTIDPNTTLVPDSLTVTPLAFGDSYATVGNTELVIDAANGLLANDSDPDSASGYPAR